VDAGGVQTGACGRPSRPACGTRAAVPGGVGFERRTCNGALAADLGPAGYHSPEAPVTFIPADGGSADSTGNRFWVVADVAFTDDKCSKTGCVVKPIHADSAQKTPYFVLASDAMTSFTPPYPPLP
jgi:hypothetical protein